MARNKHPEETVHKILEVSFRLFKEKGYDHTTIQDIVNALGMSKGAVYHHFKSKEAIFDQINEEYYNAVNWFAAIRMDPQLTGLEKIKGILNMQLSDKRKYEIDNIHIALEHNPRLVSMMLESTLHDASPLFCELVEEGIRDGSIKTSHPRELSEVTMLIINVWLGLFAASAEDLGNKLDFLEELTGRLGLPLIDEALKQTVLRYFEKVGYPGQT